MREEGGLPAAIDQQIARLTHSLLHHKLIRQSASSAHTLTLTQRDTRSEGDRLLNISAL